jgi:hypothetical protein
MAGHGTDINFLQLALNQIIRNPSTGNKTTTVNNILPSQRTTVADVSKCGSGVCLKVLNPNRKKDYRSFNLDNVMGILDVKELRKVIFDKVGKVVVSHKLDFEVGYFEGNSRMSFPSDFQKFQQALHYIVSNGKYLWCYGVSDHEVLSSDEDRSGPSRKKVKKPNSENVSRVNSLEAKSDRVDAIAKDLKEKHGDKYTQIQYKLWAEVIDTKKHTSIEEPPLGSIWKTGEEKSRNSKGQSTLESAFTTLANSVAAAIQPAKESPVKHTEQQTHSTVGISPGRKIDLQAKVLQNLQITHTMYEKGAITDVQFEKSRDSLLKQLDMLDYDGKN